MDVFSVILIVVMLTAVVPIAAYWVMFASSLGWHRAKYRSYHQQIVDKM